VDEAAGTLVNSKRTFPRVSSLIHKAVSAILTKNERKLFVNFLFQFLWIFILDLLDHLLQLIVDAFLRLQDHSVEVGHDTDVGHIGQALRRKALAASKTLSFFHDSPHTVIRVIESLSH